jgi:hypothetical protein
MAVVTIGDSLPAWASLITPQNLSLVATPEEMARVFGVPAPSAPAAAPSGATALRLGRPSGMAPSAGGTGAADPCASAVAARARGASPRVIELLDIQCRNAGGSVALASGGVAMSVAPSAAPLATLAPVPSYTQAQADAEAAKHATPWTLIAAGVGVLAIGAVVALKLRKR